MRILLIEDDPDLCYSLSFQLKKEGYETDTCKDGADAFYYLNQSVYDLVLLDRMLPHADGLTILKKLRQTENPVPVILLTALGETNDKIKGLDAGADDYLVKPFDFNELLARIRSICRRPRIYSADESKAFADLLYNSVGNILTGPNGSCTLSKREGALLEYLLENSTQILPRQNLLTRVWGPDAEIEEGNLDNYIYFIRRRMKSVGSKATIQTLRGIGYQLTEGSL